LPVPVPPKTVVVVPRYCEADRLDPASFVAAADRHDWLYFVFVDDGSTDRTYDVLARGCAVQERMVHTRLPRNQSKGAPQNRRSDRAARRPSGKARRGHDARRT